MNDLSWLQNPKSWHWLLVRRWAGVNKSDGCTVVPDFHKDCCYYHDKLYREGTDFEHEFVSRKEADRRFRLCIQSRSKLGRFSPMSWWRWAGVRLFGADAYKGT